MEKKIGRKGRSSMTVEQWSLNNYPLPAIPDWIFNRHLRKRAKYKHKYRKETVVFDIGGGWYVHILRNGKLMLSVLPF